MHRRNITIELSERAEGASVFPCSISSETPVRRRDYDGEYDEILSHAKGAVDLSRQPLPVIESHDRTRVNIAVVENLRLEGSRLRGDLRFGQSARGKELAADVEAGIVRSLSVGYAIASFRRDEKATPPKLTATRWTPHEVSLCSVPADASVGIGRSLMDPETTQTENTDVLAERKRTSEISTLARRFKLDDSIASELIDRGVPLADARTRILNELAARSDATPTDGHLGERALISAGRDENDFQRATVDAILTRAGVPVKNPHRDAQGMSASVYDIARVCLSRAGRPGMARGEALIRSAMTTSDFSGILTSAIGAAIRNGYETEPSTHRQWVRVAEVADFREQYRPILSSSPALERVLEGGEYRSGGLTEDSTSYKVAKYGRIVSLSFELLVNDHLGSFARAQPALGMAARRLEADLAYALFAENAGAGPNQSDGKALFHADHNNAVDPAVAFGASLLSAGRTLLRRQTALGGGVMNLRPKHLIVSPAYETDAEILIANASRAISIERATPEWLGALDLVVEARLDDTAAYLAAGSEQVDTFELGLLDIGGPTLEESREFIKDQISWKCRHVCGVKCLDFRGMAKLPVSPASP